MSARTAVLAGQKAAERNMVESVRVVRPTTTQDPVTHVGSVEEVPVWSGPCKVQTYEPDAIDMVSAGRPVSSQEDRLHVPVDAGPFEIGDLAYVAGYSRPYRIDGLIRKSFQTAQRLKVTMQANSK